MPTVETRECTFPVCRCENPATCSIELPAHRVAVTGDAYLQMQTIGGRQYVPVQFLADAQLDLRKMVRRAEQAEQKLRETSNVLAQLQAMIRD